MKRLYKKGALELSINAIVIVILAMTLLGLGLGFIRNMMSSIQDMSSQVTDQQKQQILDDLRRGDKKLSFPTGQVDIDKGKAILLAVGVKNTGSLGLDFKIFLQDISTGTADNIVSGLEHNVDGGTPHSGKYTFTWDITDQNLGATESRVYGINLRADNSASGLEQIKMRLCSGTPPITTCTAEYESKSFFVNFR